MDELTIAKQSAASMWQGDRASHALGIEIDVPAAGAATASMLIREDMLNGFDVCHGGLIFALADTAFAFACNASGRQTVAASAQIEFLRPALQGDQLLATASQDYRGRRTGYYTVEIRNQQQRIVALFRGRATETSSAAAVRE